MTKQRKKPITLPQAEEMLQAMNLILWAVESDCKGRKFLKKLKKHVSAARKELKNIPIPKNMKRV